MTVQITVAESDGKTIQLNGRQAWAMLRLIKAGNQGCVPLSDPAPRWADYIFKLRSHGFMIETITETHRGPFPGHHARYVLRSPVLIVEDEEAA